VEQTAALTVLPYGDRALLVEVADLAEVAAVRAALEGAPLPGQRGEEPFVDVAPVRAPSSAPVLRVLPGPRRDWLDPAAWTALTTQEWTVTADSNRVGLRLAGAPLERARDDELPSEGLVPGALQVPPDGAPVLFLADHPVTGGYPVLAVVTTADLPAAAQLRPGDTLTLRAVR
jgi:allophanate hydrolase subunit 2